MIFLNIGVLLVSLGLTYALFVRLRVVCLRQDIYDLRDKLFDEVVASDGCSDPAYVQARKLLNGLAVSADMLSLPLVFQCSFMSGDEVTLLKSENLHIQSAIDSILEQATVRVFKYLKRQTATGWLMSAIMLCFEAHQWEQRTMVPVMEQLSRNSANRASKRNPLFGF